MRHSILVLSFSCSMFLSTGIWSQRPVTVGVSFLNEHISDPTIVQDGRPIHPGVSIFVEVERKRGKVFQYHHIFELGHYYHRDFNQAFFLRWKPKFSWTIGQVVGMHGLLGIGYAHSFPTRKIYRFSEGKYKSSKPLGLPHLMPSLGLGLSIKGDQLLDLPMEIFAHYELFSLAPYSIRGEIPFTINTLLSVGIKYRLTTTSQHNGQ